MTATSASRPSMFRRAARRANAVLRRRGFEVRRTGRRADAMAGAVEFRVTSRGIYARHVAQSLETVAALRKKYEAPVFGRVRVWDLIERLALCIDPSDSRLFCASQQVHVLQMLEGMERDGVTDPDLVLVTLLHDLGKLLLLIDEDPANVACMNTPIGNFEDRIGFDESVFQWNHDEFGYSRFKDHVPDHIAWLIRYHSLELAACERLMDDRDRDYFDRYLSILARYDNDTKSPTHLPALRMDSYRDLIEEAFPNPILF